MADPLRSLQMAARQAAAHVCPGVPAKRVVVYGSDGSKLLDVTVPTCLGEVAEGEKIKVIIPGWELTDKRAFFDGKPVTVAASRLRLLKVLIDADGPLAAKELAKLAFTGRADEETARYHIRELRRELKESLEFEADPIPGEGGYRLIL